MIGVGQKVYLTHGNDDILGTVSDILEDDRVVVTLHSGADLICPVSSLTVVGKRAASKGPTSAAH
jgi:hypothetical protein